MRHLLRVFSFLAATLALSSLTTAYAADLAVNAYTPFPVGSPRVMGMAGAFTGIGSGAEALIANPAAVLRPDGFSIRSVDFDYMLSYTRQGEGVNSDFGNVGPALHGDEYSVVLGVGFIARWGDRSTRFHGAGIHVLDQSYYFLDDTGGAANLSLSSPRFSYGRSYGSNNEILVSFSLDIGSPTLDYLPPGEIQPVKVDYRGLGGIPLEVGLLWVPRSKPFQFGARLKGPYRAEATRTLPAIDPFPSSVVFPGEFSVGAAYTFGERLPEGSGEWFDRVIVDFDLRGIFPEPGSTGFERFRSVDPLEMLADPLLQPALGVEIELYTRMAWLWFGTYHEPPRYDDVPGRWHATSGFKLRLFQFKGFGLYLSVAGDSAERFNVWTSSISTGPGRF